MDITQKELAARINVGGSTISGYEKGDKTPSIPVLIQIADVYDVSLDYLLGRTEIRTSFRKFQAGLKAAGGPIPVDMLFRLNETDKELVRMLLVSLSGKPEYGTAPKAKGKRPGRNP